MGFFTRTAPFGVGPCMTPFEPFCGVNQGDGASGFCGAGAGRVGTAVGGGGAWRFTAGGVAGGDDDAGRLSADVGGGGGEVGRGDGLGAAAEGFNMDFGGCAVFGFGIVAP